MLRYALAAAEPGGPSTTNASSSVMRYRKGLSPVSSPDAFFPLTRPQMVSTDCPKVFFRKARFISPNSADAGTSNFAAIAVFAIVMTGSDGSAGWPDAGGSASAAAMVDFAFFAARCGLSRSSSDESFSVFAAIVVLAFIVAELALNDV